MGTESNKAENEKTGSGHLQHLVMPGSKWRFPMRNSRGKIQYYTRIITIVRKDEWLVGGINLTAFWDKPLGSIARTHTTVEQILKGRQVA